MKKTFSACFLFLLCATSAIAQSIEEAKKLTENEQYETASEIYKALNSKNPHDASLYYYYGENLLLGDNADSAKIIFEKGKAIDPQNPFIKIGNAKVLFDEINFREAKAASEKDPGNGELRSRKEQALSNITEAMALIDAATANAKDISLFNEAAEALIKYTNKDTDKAKALLDRASAIDQKNIETLLLFGDLYTELNNGTLAADYYNKALDLNKSSARAIVNKGALYYRSTNYEGAAREFESAISIDAAHAPAHRLLAEAYVKLGKLSLAISEYQKYLSLSKNKCIARIRYATFLYFAKSYADAITEFNNAKQRCDSNIITFVRYLAYSYYETKDTANGLYTIKRLFSLLTPEKLIDRDYEFYGKLLIASDQDSLGIEQLQKAYALNPKNTELLSDMATAWMKLKQYSNSITLLNQKIETGDARLLDYYTLSRSYYYNQQFQEADSAAAKVNELSPKWASGWMLRAQINAQIDSTSKDGLAKPYYEKYIEIAESDSSSKLKYNNGLNEAYRYLAYYYILKKDANNEKIYLKKRLELQLEPKERKDILDRLENRGKPGKQ